MSQRDPDLIRLFPGGGGAGDALRACDWQRTALGGTAKWPLALKAHVRAMLATRQATCIFWGAEYVNLYNDGFVPLLGEKHPRAMGQGAREVWSDAWPVVGKLLDGVFIRGEAVLFQEMLIPISRAGRLDDAWWNYSYSPLFGDDGAIAGILVVATEMTAEVRGRKQLEATKIEADRARLRESELRASAEGANRAKDEFLAVVSHELRNPLNAILGWARTLRTVSDPSRLAKGLAVIERNASAQANLIDDILDVSRIVSGKLLLDPRRVRVATIVQNAVESIRPALQAKGIRLTLAFEHDEIDLVADAERLQQVVWNILSNAAKFTPEGGAVRVDVGHVDGHVSIRVSDTGKGIAPEFLPLVFDRFRQADPSTTKRHGGLGLGLAIVRHLVELHGGRVNVTSDGEGRGATFELVLPVGAVEARGMAVTARAEGTGAGCEEGDVTGAPSLKGLRVLVVDDEPDARELVATVLLDAGAQVIEASSVGEALAALGAARAMVVVADIGMPFEDGYSLMRAVRANEATRGIPALALTAYARAEDRAKARAAGFDDHAAKPVDPDDLVRRIAALARQAGHPH